MIRSYIPEDMDQTLLLWEEFDRSHWQESSYFFKKPTPSEMEKRHHRYTGGENRMFLVLADGDEIRGFIVGIIRSTPDVCLLSHRRILEIHGLAVHGKYRNTKAAWQLLVGARNYGRERKVHHMEGHVWFFNHTTEKLIEGFGFQLHSKKYYRRMDD